MTVVHIGHGQHGVLVLAPEGAPLVTDAAPELDVLVLEVAGGHLSWSLLDGSPVPAAVLNNTEAAQDWLWAIYGEEVALAVADNHPQALTADPARPSSAAAVRRLAYAHWVSRWWPGSTVDGIPALDPRLLLDEIAFLTEECEMMFDGYSHELAGGDGSDGGSESDADAWDRESPPGASPTRPDDAAPLTARGGIESGARAEDYALAAGGTGPEDGLVIARGGGGWDWRRCPPGILDASEHAMSWQVTRAGGISTVRVSVVAAPDCRGEVPDHLRPAARVRSVLAQPPAVEHGRSLPSGHVDPVRDVQFPLHRRGDAWTGAIQLTGPPETPFDVSVFVPGVGPAHQVDESAMRDRLRRFARLRLSAPTGEPPLAAESAAASSDEDF